MGYGPPGKVAAFNRAYGGAHQTRPGWARDKPRFAGACRADSRRGSHCTGRAARKLKLRQAWAAWRVLKAKKKLADSEERSGLTIHACANN